MMVSTYSSEHRRRFPRQFLVLSFVFASFLGGPGGWVAQADEASQMMSQAAKLADAGKYENAANLYTRAAQSFKAKGQSQQEADAESKAAVMFEKQADQILASLAAPKAPAAANPAVANPATAAKPATVPVVKPPWPPKSPVPLNLPTMARRAGYVVGRALMADGRPIPKFQVTVAGYDARSDNGVAQGVAGTVGYDTGRQGTYAVRVLDSFSHTKPVNALVVQISAQAQVVYQGETYLMDLYPLDGKSEISGAQGRGQFSAPGLTRDFRLKIAGHIPDKDDSTDLTRQHAYYGQRIQLDDWDLSGPTLQKAAFQGANLTFTLTPQGPLLDGSTGQTIVRQLPASALGTEAGYLLDIPTGTYSLQAQVVQGGASKPLSLHWSQGDKTYKSVATLVPHPYADMTGPNPLTLVIRP